MAQPTNTFDAFDAIGIREDLSDIIQNISPTECPFMNMAGRGKGKNVKPEWQLDSLAAAVTTNAVIEGDDATMDAVTATTRVQNQMQISDKTVVISGTEEVVDKAGRKSELSYQLAKKGQELKRDMEMILSGNQASLVGNSTTPRRAGSVEAWLETNTDRHATGSDGGWNGTVVVAATDGTQRAMTEAMVKNVVQLAWVQGGEPTVFLCGPKQKQNFSAFTWGTTRYDKSEDKRVTGAVDVYVSDFGTHKLVASRFSRDRSLLVLDPSLWSVLYLRSFAQHPLAKTGDSHKRQILSEYTLCSKQEAGSGVVADLTTT